MKISKKKILYNQNFLRNMEKNSENVNEIPVVFGIDNNYIYTNIVVMTSLLANAHKNTFYKIYIMHSNDFLDKNKFKILSLKKYYKNCDIEFLEIGNKFDNYDAKSTHFTKAIFYRLEIPTRIKQKKCIYLDSDIVINDDLSELFNLNIDDYYIAGVKDGSGDALIGNDEIPYKNTLKLFMSQKIMNNYINSGVLLWNLEKIRKDNLVPQFYEFIQKYVFDEKISKLGDQDCLNLVCGEKILTLPLKYNVTSALVCGGYQSHPYVKTLYSQKEWQDAYEKPVIFHYTTQEAKPWNCLVGDKSSLWWHYANQSLYSEEIKEKYKLKN